MAGSRKRDDWADPEAQMMRLEEEDELDDEEHSQAGVLQRLDELLADFTPAERKMFWYVFVDGMTVARAARESGVTGNIHNKLRKMMETLKDVL